MVMGNVVPSLRSGGVPNNKRRSTKKYIQTYDSEAVKLNSERAGYRFVFYPNPKEFIRISVL